MARKSDNSIEMEEYYESVFTYLQSIIENKNVTLDPLIEATLKKIMDKAHLSRIDAATLFRSMILLRLEDFEGS